MLPPTMPNHALPRLAMPYHASPCPTMPRKGLGRARRGLAGLGEAQLGSDKARAGIIICRSPGRNINLPESAGENAYLLMAALSLRLW